MSAQMSARLSAGLTVLSVAKIVATPFFGQLQGVSVLKIVVAPFFRTITEGCHAQRRRI